MGGLKKGKIKKVLKKIHGIQTWKMFLVLILLLFVDATLLRIDHIRMANLKNAVLEADKNGGDEEIESKLKELKDFTSSHIVVNITEENGNQKVTFGTGVFNLENQYLRAANAALEQAKNKSVEGNPNGNVYAMASAVCDPIAAENGWSWDDRRHVDCMMAEIEKYPGAETLDIKADIPPVELYRHEFVSPVWTFSVSGVAILITVVLFVVIFTRVVIWITLRILMFFLKSR